MEPRKFVIPEFVLGEGAIDLVPQYAQNLGVKKALLVTDSGVISYGWAGKIQAVLEREGIKYEIFSDVSPNPRDYEVMSGAELYLQKQCNIIIAVGGGSPMDCAKGIGIVTSNDEHILRFAGVDKISLPSPPLICVPTTAGSSADVSQFAIITDSESLLKIAIISKAIVPDAALIDPLTSTTMPKELTVNTGMDAFTHGIEAIVSNANSPVTDMHAFEALRLVKKALPKAAEYPTEVDYRNFMMLGSLLAGLAFSNASLGLVHAMTHSLGGKYDLAHGECNAVMLEHVINYNFDSAAEQYCHIAEAIGIDCKGLTYNQKKQRLIESIISFKREVGVTKSLSDMGVQKNDIPFCAKHAYYDPCTATNPKEPSIQDIEEIYENAL